jgi:glycerol-3-phosphate dehydrogenase (NAD(P)+)
MSGIGVLGGGAWGTALALTVLRAGHRPTLHARDGEAARAIAAGENPRYLPGIPFETGIDATGDLAALEDKDILLSVVPAQSLRKALGEAANHIAPDATIVICAKGIEHATGSLLSSVVAEVLPGRAVAALSGPSFASDVARKLPTAVTIASEEPALAARLAALLTSPFFRCYSSDDLVGVEIGGALKNVLAIAAGAVAGAGLGASAQAAMVTRGFVELRRFGVAFGARPETLMGLSGLGDLMLTCASTQSRNFAYGMALGRGESLEGRPLAEGVATAGVAARICEERAISAPIMQAVAAILQRDITIAEAVESLMTRPLKSEHE